MLELRRRLSPRYQCLPALLCYLACLFAVQYDEELQIVQLLVHWSQVLTVRKYPIAQLVQLLVAREQVKQGVVQREQPVPEEK